MIWSNPFPTQTSVQFPEAILRVCPSHGQQRIRHARFCSTCGTQCIDATDSIREEIAKVLSRMNGKWRTSDRNMEFAGWMENNTALLPLLPRESSALADSLEEYIKPWIRIVNPAEPKWPENHKIFPSIYQFDNGDTWSECMSDYFAGLVSIEWKYARKMNRHLKRKWRISGGVK